MIRETFTVEGPVRVEVSASSGSVSVEEGPPGSVDVEIDTRQPDAWRVSQTGSSIVVTYERGLIDRGGRARVRIALPAGSSLSVYTASADVNITTRLDRVSVATASGEVRMGDAGDTAVKTASGDVTAGAISGDLAVRTASGDVRVDTGGGRTSLTTVSGDITVGRLDGDTSISTASGDVRLQHYAGPDLEGATVSGDLMLGLPSGRTVKLQAKSLSGSVRLPERKHSTGSGGPEVSLRLRSVSGDIRIERVS